MKQFQAIEVTHDDQPCSHAVTMNGEILCYVGNMKHAQMIAEAMTYSRKKINDAVGKIKSFLFACRHDGDIVDALRSLKDYERAEVWLTIEKECGV